MTLSRESRLICSNVRIDGEEGKKKGKKKKEEGREEGKTAAPFSSFSKSPVL